jgi:hypothetical protein
MLPLLKWPMREIEKDQPTLPSSRYSALFLVLKNLLNVG